MLPNVPKLSQTKRSQTLPNTPNRSQTHPNSPKLRSHSDRSCYRTTKLSVLRDKCCFRRGKFMLKRGTVIKNLCFHILKEACYENTILTSPGTLPDAPRTLPDAPGTLPDAPGSPREMKRN